MQKQPTIIHCEEVAVDPIIVTLGDISINIAKISAYNTIRFYRIINEAEAGTADADDVARLILDIAAEQGLDLTEEDILKAGNQKQLAVFIQTVTLAVLKLYKPLEDAVRPFLHRRKEAPAK